MTHTFCQYRYAPDLRSSYQIDFRVRSDVAMHGRSQLFVNVTNLNLLIRILNW